MHSNSQILWHLLHRHSEMSWRHPSILTVITKHRSLLRHLEVLPLAYCLDFKDWRWKIKIHGPRSKNHFMSKTIRIQTTSKKHRISMCILGIQNNCILRNKYRWEVSNIPFREVQRTQTYALFMHATFNWVTNSCFSVNSATQVFLLRFKIHFGKTFLGTTSPIFRENAILKPCWWFWEEPEKSG